MTLTYTCDRCGGAIDDDPHTDSEDRDVHADCCDVCTPGLSSYPGPSIDDLLHAARDRDTRADYGPTPILGHGGGLTGEQMARGERWGAA